MLAITEGPRGQATFSIDQVAKTLGVTPAIITNHQHNNGLDFCSEAPGRGSPRLFCTLDVYMLVLLREILALTGDANRAARDVNRLVYSDGDRKVPPSRRASLKRQLRKDHLDDITHELFTHRPMAGLPFGHNHMDWFLLMHNAQEGFRPVQNTGATDYRLEEEFASLLYQGQLARTSGAFINATMKLRWVDEQLSRICGGRKQ